MSTVLTKKILCIGGSGQLGRHFVSTMLPYSVTNVDFTNNPNTKLNIALKSNLTAAQNNKEVINYLKKQGKGNLFDAIIVTAGGWVGGSIKDDDYAVKAEKMLQVNLMPSLLAAHLATKYLAQKGLVVLTGAAAVFKQPQPEMLAYSIAKTGVHSLALNLTQTFLSLEKQQRVITILPETIDTQSNRQAMPTSDFTKWAKPNQIAQLVKGWVDGLNLPNNGSFVLLKVKNGCINPEFV